MSQINYCADNGSVALLAPDSFNIEQILECGQCFRFKRGGEMSYEITAMDRVVTLTQLEDRVIFAPCSREDFESVWIDYFDLNTDYSQIKAAISRDDEIMQAAVGYGGGIRLLNQDPYEALISFIISQNNNIPRIKGIIERMSERCGDKCGGGRLFPSLERLAELSERDIYELRVGFRARYIRDALDRLLSGEVSLDGSGKSTEELRAELMRIKGVGRKVADCVLLFALRRREVFPADVWIRRVMSELYFGGRDASIEDIHSLAREKWGIYAGYAQQYLFYCARSGKLGGRL